MYRLLYVCYVLVLLQGTKSAYAQTASVPVTITLEGVSEPVLPIPVVNRTNLAVKIGGPSETFAVSLSSEPLEETTVSWGLDDNLPLGGKKRDLDLSLESFTFTSENWDEKQLVTVTANTDAQTEEYSIIFKIAGNSGGSTFPKVSVKVKNRLEINFSSPWEIYVDQHSPRLLPVTLTVEEGFIAPVQLTLSIPNKPDYLQIYRSGSRDGGVLNFDDSNYNVPQNFILERRTNVVVSRHRFVVTARQGTTILGQKGGFIEILPDPCRVQFDATGAGELNFGTWIRPEEVDEEGSITVSSFTGDYTYDPDLTLVGTPTTNKFRVSTTNCRGCNIGPRVSSSDTQLEGPESAIISLNTEWSVWLGDRLHFFRSPLLSLIEGRLVSRIVFTRNVLENPVITAQLGGTISDISGDESLTPGGTYSGTIIIYALCWP